MADKKLGRQVPIRQKFNGGYFFVQRKNGTIETVPSLDDYYDSAKDAAPPPETVDWTPKAMSAISEVYGNDQQGDCVIASAMHEVGLWTGNDGAAPVIGTTQEALSTYRKWCGPGDNGCDITSVLNLTKSHGVPCGGAPHKIDGYVSVDNSNKLLCQVAIDLFATLKLGIDLPQEWYDSEDIWDVTNSRIIGGHDVPVAGFTPQGVIILTWGGKRLITWKAFLSTKWITECYAPLAPDWYGKDNLAPNGIDAATLKANLDAIANGQIPPIGPPPELPLDWLI